MANDEMLEYLWDNSQKKRENPISKILENLKSEIDQEITYYKIRYKAANDLKKDLTDRLRTKEDELALYKDKLCMLQQENEELKKKEECNRRMWVPHHEYARLYQENKRKDERINLLQKRIEEIRDKSISLNTFVKNLKVSNDKVTLKAFRDVALFLFDGDEKKIIDAEYNQRLALLDRPTNINYYNAPVGQVGEYIQNNQLLSHEK